MPAEALTYGDFLEEVTTRATDSGLELSKGQIKRVVEAVAVELGDCLASGYKVGIPGIGIFTPVAKKGRKKGTEVRNPFDNSTKKLDATEPDSIKVKVRPNSKLKAAMPEPGSADAKKLVKVLA